MPEYDDLNGNQTELPDPPVGTDRITVWRSGVAYKEELEDLDDVLAVVTAYDAATGQLQIGGIEMGDTGWRKILSWTSGVQDGSDQVGTINTSNWTLAGNGNVQIRRVGPRVFVNFEAGVDSSAGISASSTGNTQLTTGIPAGFYPGNRHMGPIGQHPHGASTNIIAAGIGRFTSAGALAVNIATSGQRLANCEGSYDVLGEAWPSSLPGVAA